MDSNWNTDNFQWEDAYVKVNHLFPMIYPFAITVMDDFTNTTQNKIFMVIKINHN